MWFVFAPPPRTDDPVVDDRVLSRDACRALATRVFAMAEGGGSTRLGIEGRWTSNMRWAKNRFTTAGETWQTDLDIVRTIRGAQGHAGINALDDAALRECVRRAEALRVWTPESPDNYPDPLPTVHPFLQPSLWYDRTVAPDPAVRVEAAERLMASAISAECESAGYVEVAGRGRGLVTTEGFFRYYPFTTVQASLTVRDPAHRGSGWAGVDWNDWSRLDVSALAQTALDKCQQSRNPVAVEPGRYTTLLEPQAVHDLLSPLVGMALYRSSAEQGEGPFADPARPGWSRIGQRVMDRRVTLSADPMDPECGFVPFDENGEPYQAVSWVESGVLRALSYGREYGLRMLGSDRALPNPRAYRMRGGDTTIEQMIAGTTRGILVTRFGDVSVMDWSSMLSLGTTRDGVWLIERGKISKPLMNLRFVESSMFVLNNIEALGTPRRVFSPNATAVVPPLLVRDFSFTGLSDAV